MGRGLAQGSATVLAMWKTVPACVVATQLWMSVASAVDAGPSHQHVIVQETSRIAQAYVVDLLF